MPEPRATLLGVSGAKALRIPLEAAAGREPEAPLRLPVTALVVAGALASLDGPRTGLWLAVAAVAAGFLIHALLLRVSARRGRGSLEATAKAWLVLDEKEVTRVWTPARPDGPARTTLARWDTPFGLSVLANAGRSRALLAFTTPSATRFLGLRLTTARDADLARELLARAITVADVDLDLAAGHADVQLGAASAQPLVDEVDRRDPHAFQRIYLVDARGAAVIIDRERLTVGERAFDLSSPLEWRVFTFQDGDAAVLYQATSVRQGVNDAVLVCRAPAELGSWSVGKNPDPPPPREARVAIDRIFMTPLRAALEQAPRVSRPGPPPSRSRGKTVAT